MSELSIIPMTLKEASAYVAEHHRHHEPPRGALFAVAVARGKSVAGVAIIGRPVARMLQDDFTAEVTRLCTDGTRNACSMLYGAAWRAARALGYRRLVTYTLPEEGGASLRAAGWRLVGEAGGGHLEPALQAARRHAPAAAQALLGGHAMTGLHTLALLALCALAYLLCMAPPPTDSRPDGGVLVQAVEEDEGP